MATDAHQTILDLIADLKENVFTQTSEKSDLVFIELFFKRMPPQSVLNHIIDHVLPHEKQIRERNLSFFLENEGIFSGLPASKTQHYMDVIANSKRISEEDMDQIWKYMEVLVEIAKKHKKCD